MGQQFQTVNYFKEIDDPNILFTAVIKMASLSVLYSRKEITSHRFNFIVNWEFFLVRGANSVVSFRLWLLKVIKYDVRSCDTLLEKKNNNNNKFEGR